MAERNKHLDAVKGFAILVVMLGHCIGRNNMDDPYINDAIKALQMPLFMLVSGYIGGMGKKEVMHLADFGKKVGKRAVSYLVPFFSWVFVVSLLRPFDSIQNPFVESWKVLFAIDNGLWFLMTIFVIQVVVMTAEFLANQVTASARQRKMTHEAASGEPENSGRGVLHMCTFFVLVFACYIGFVLWARSGNTFLGPSFTVQYLPFYLMGYLVSHYLQVWLAEASAGSGKLAYAIYKMIQKKAFMWTLWGICAVAFLYMVVCFDLQSKQNTVEMLRQMLASTLGSFVCFYGVYHLPIKHRYGLSFIGMYTLEIYTLHFRFVDMLGFKDQGLSVYSEEGMGAIIVTFLVMSFMSGIIIYFVKKVRILDLLLFGKIQKS